MHYASNMHPKSENEHKPCIRMHKNLHKPHDFYALYSQYAIICINRINPDASTSPTMGTCPHRMDIITKRTGHYRASDGVTRENPKTSTRAYLASRSIPWYMKSYTILRLYIIIIYEIVYTDSPWCKGISLYSLPSDRVPCL